MSRRDALYRALFGILYLPLYYLVLYPVVFVLGVIVAGIDIGWTLLTGRSLQIKPAWTSNAWERISAPVTYVFSGDERRRPHWLP